MKVRTKEENAAYHKAYRARKSAQPVTPAPITPVTPSPKRNTRSITPVTPAPPIVSPAAPAVCSGCQEKIAEIARLRDRVAALVARIDAPAVSKDEAEALRQRVIADKVNRIKTYSNGHVIGSALR